MLFASPACGDIGDIWRHLSLMSGACRCDMATLGLEGPFRCRQCRQQVSPSRRCSYQWSSLQKKVSSRLSPSSRWAAALAVTSRFGAISAMPTKPRWTKQRDKLWRFHGTWSAEDRRATIGAEFHKRIDPTRPGICRERRERRVAVSLSYSHCAPRSSCVSSPR